MRFEIPDMIKQKDINKMKKLLALFFSLAILCLSSTVVEATSTANGAQIDSYEAMNSNANLVTISVNVKSGQDITKEVNQKLTEAHNRATENTPYKIVIPNGNYMLSGALHIYSNTIIDAGDATISFMDSAPRNNMIITGVNAYNDSSQCSGYNGFQNIAIKGGNWVNSSNNSASLLKAMHATNVSIEDAVFVGGGGAHQLEICAIKNLKIYGCTFKDFYGKENSSDKQECLQLDVPCSESVYKNTYQDGTTLENVTIANNSFVNASRGLGTHTQLLGAYHENILIEKNSFTNIDEECIVALDYYNCQIRENTINNCGGGILVQTFKTKTPKTIYVSVDDGNYTKSVIQTDMKINITKNRIKIKYNSKCDETEGIKLYGGYLTSGVQVAKGQMAEAGDYRAKGITVTANTITTAGYGIHLSAVGNTTISSNKIVGANYSSKDALKNKYDGIFLNDSCTDITIVSNSITTPSRHGIFIMNSDAKMVSKNKISSTKAIALCLNHARVDGAIKNNKISKSGSLAISLADNSKAELISGNSITGSKNKSIGIARSSSVPKGISKNSISNGNGTAISITSKSSVGTVKNNVFKKINGNGIIVYDKSKVDGDIIMNTYSKLEGKFVTATEHSKIAGSVKNNKKK